MENPFKLLSPAGFINPMLKAFKALTCTLHLPAPFGVSGPGIKALRRSLVDRFTIVTLVEHQDGLGFLLKYMLWLLSYLSETKYSQFEIICWFIPLSSIKTTISATKHYHQHERLVVLYISWQSKSNSWYMHKRLLLASRTFVTQNWQTSFFFRNAIELAYYGGNVDFVKS